MILLALLLAACPPAGDPERVFASEVAPILQASCADSTCHGVTPEAELAGEDIDWTLFYLRVDDEGRLLDPAAARETSLAWVNTVEDPLFSSLIRKPLDPAWGGEVHQGRVQFPSPADAELQAIAAWIALEARGGEDPAPLDPLEARFATEVQPVLFGLTCATGGCHGPTSAIPFRLDPGVGGAVPLAATRANRHAVLETVALDGDPLQSRLLRKSLPLAKGGILHKGGNAAFLRDAEEPRARVILDWICAEREALGSPCADEAPTGIVFVRGPLLPKHPFDLDVFTPGTGLFHLALEGPDLLPGEVTDLTAGLHDGPFDARDPAVHPDGQRVAFTLRTSEDGGHDLWLLDLATGETTRLTDDAGPLPGGGVRTYREPAWGPDDTLWFVSTGAGVLAEGGLLLDGDLYEMDLATRHVRRRTITPHVERDPTWLDIGEEAAGQIAFTALRETVPGQAVGHPFRFPPGLETEYHQHFGVTAEQDLTHSLREMPDGRYALIAGDLADPYRLGALAILDRNFGPHLPSTSPWQDPALPFYADPMVLLDSDGFFRDPAPLADGRLLAAWAPGPLDPETGVVLLDLVETPEGPRIAERRVLVDTPGLSDRHPRPVRRRLLRPLTGPVSWEEGAETARIHHQGLPMVDALLDNLPPSGPKVPRSDMVAVRLVEHLPLTPLERLPVPPEETRDAHPDATTSGLGPLPPARALAEIPLAADGSFRVEAPAGLAVRIQGVDADGVAVGLPHNRWFDLHPGQVVPQGVQPRHYGTLCAACHGSASGAPEEAFLPPDLLTTASLTLSRYQDQDRRRPLPPVEVGDATRLEVDFERDVLPVLVARCAGCHQGPDAPAGLSLTDTPTTWFVDAYESLLAPGEGSRNGGAWVDAVDGTAAGSHLAEVLLGRELDAPASLEQPGAPHPADLPEEERRLLLRWMDLGATWRGAP